MKIISLLLKLRDKYVERRLNGLGEEERFRLIYKSGYWKGIGGSLSGAGSNLDSSKNIRTSLKNFIDKHSIGSILDLPCGDFFWMSKMDLSDLLYVGGEIVEDIVNKNNQRFGREGCTFKKIDILHDELPKAGLVFVRDCLVHLENDQIFRAIKNIIQSGSTYLAITTYPDLKTNFKSLQKDRWRPLNMSARPFLLPEPIELLDDRFTGNPPIHKNKYIGVWKISDISLSSKDI